MSADEVLRKGSGTLCESLLMVEAYAANVICPNKQQDDSRAMHDGRLLESETYVGGHVECLQTGVYRNNLPIKFRLEPEALQVRIWAPPRLPDPPPLLPLTPPPPPPPHLTSPPPLNPQGLLDRLDETLQYAIEHEGGVSLSEVTNYDEVKEQIASRLRELRDNPERKETPIIYHLDVGAMYPNIILTNRLQPPATVSEQMCAACVHNRPESNCKRPLKWMWRGEVFPASKAESDNIRNQLEYETVIELTSYRPPTNSYHLLPLRYETVIDKEGNARPFLDLDASEQNQKFRARLKDFCQKAYKKTHVTKMEERVATTCQRENPFYIDTVRAFRDRRYEYKALNKKWGKKRAEAEKADDIGSLLEAKSMCTLYDSLQVTGRHCHLTTPTPPTTTTPTSPPPSPLRSSSRTSASSTRSTAT